MKKRFGSLLLTLVLMLGLAFTLASCGGEKVAQGITEDSIIVGNTAAVTGDYSTVGIPFNLAMQVVFDEYNAARKEGERKIVFKHYDDKFDGQLGLTYTKTLVEEDKVFALVGHFGTNTIEATMDYLLDKGVPMVYGVSGVNSLYFEKEKGNNILSVQPIYRTEGQLLVARILHEELFGPNKDQKLGANDTIVVLHSEDDAGNSIKLGIEDELKAQNANSRAIYLPFKAETAVAVVDNALSKNPAVIILAANQGPATPAATALRQKNSTVSVFTSYVNAVKQFTPAQEIVGGVAQPLPYDVYANAWVDISKADAPAPTAEQVGGDGTLVGFPLPLDYLPGFTAEYWDFVKLMNNSTRTDGDTSARALWADSYAIAGYVAAKTFVSLLERVEDFDTLTWSKFIELAESAPIKVPMAGTIDWTDGKRHGLAELALTKLSYSPTVSFVKVREIESKSNINKK
jgi:ABC-type branched-subunit amino acid transport system substrate-binding protein